MSYDYSRSLKTKWNKKKFQDGPKFCIFLKSYMTLLYLLIIDFPKFDPLTAQGWLFQYQNLFTLFSDQAELNSALSQTKLNSISLSRRPSGIIESPLIVARSKIFVIKP